MVNQTTLTGSVRLCKYANNCNPLHAHSNDTGVHGAAVPFSRISMSSSGMQADAMLKSLLKEVLVHLQGPVKHCWPASVCFAGTSLGNGYYCSQSATVSC